MKKQELLDQLKSLGKKPPFLARAEFKILPKLLLPGEKVEDLVVGIYVGTYALMVSTDSRLIIIDKMPGALVTEDIPYDMIAEVEYHRTAFKTEAIIYTRADSQPSADR